MFIKDALQRIKSERVKSPEISHRKAMRSGLEVEDIISACCEHFGVTRQELIGDLSGAPRKACIYLTKNYTPATNRDIAEKSGEHIDRMKAKYSFFKG